MDSTRQNKIARLLQNDFAQIFQSWTQEFYRGMLISVTKVKVTSDLSLARVNLSIFPSSQAQALIGEIRSKKPFFRDLLARRVRNQLRIIPDLEFFIDDSLDYIENIEKELRGEGENPIKNPKPKK